MPKMAAQGGGTDLAIFGAAGDLAQRMLLSSRFARHADGLIAPDFRILGSARRELFAGFRHLADGAEEGASPILSAGAL